MYVLMSHFLKLISVNAPHTRGQVLGVLQFLHKCVEIQCEIDPLEDLMYPLSFNDDSDDWEYNVSE